MAHCMAPHGGTQVSTALLRLRCFTYPKGPCLKGVSISLLSGLSIYYKYLDPWATICHTPRSSVQVQAPACRGTVRSLPNRRSDLFHSRAVSFQSESMYQYSKGPGRKRGSCILTLGPMYIPKKRQYRYLDPLGMFVFFVGGGVGS